MGWKGEPRSEQPAVWFEMRWVLCQDNYLTARVSVVRGGQTLKTINFRRWPKCRRAEEGRGQCVCGGAVGWVGTTTYRQLPATMCSLELTTSHRATPGSAPRKKDNNGVFGGPDLTIVFACEVVASLLDELASRSDKSG